jgi:hypothetical protein
MGSNPVRNINIYHTTVNGQIDNLADIPPVSIKQKAGVGHRMDLDVSDNILPLPGFEPTTKS